MASVLQLLTAIAKRPLMLVSGVVLVGAAVAFGVFVFDGGRESGPELVEPECVNVEIPPSPQADADFDVSFSLANDPDCTAAGPDQIIPPKILRLWDGDEWINNLLSGSEPVIGPPVENPMVTLDDHRGPGPYTFGLPRLDDGTYVLCGVVTVSSSSDRTEMNESPSEPFCRSITVE